MFTVYSVKYAVALCLKKVCTLLKKMYCYLLLRKDVGVGRQGGNLLAKTRKRRKYSRYN